MQTILVPLDGSAFAESSLPLAANIAKRTGARLVLLAVYHPALPEGGVQGAPAFDRRWDAEARAALRSYLDGAKQRIVDTQQIGTEAVLLEGSPTERIAGYAEGAAADLVVLASHGRGGVSRLWLGSVAEGLLRRLDVPMLVVRPTETAEPSRPVDGFRHVLVPLDGTPGSEQIFEPVLTLAGTRDVEYTLLRVVTPLDRLLRAVTTEAETARETAEQRVAAESYLATAALQLQRRGARVRTEVRLHTDPARAILAAAEGMDAELIAVSTHGGGAVERALLGSVADKVLRGSTVPVLLRRIVRESADHLATTGQSAVGAPVAEEHPTGPTIYFSTRAAVLRVGGGPLLMTIQPG